MCLICMKYRIIILMIIIISLGEILLSYIYISNTSRTQPRTRMHACTRAHALKHTHHRLRSGSMRRWRPSVTKLTPSFMASSWVIQLNTCAGDQLSRGFGCFSRIKILLGRTDRRTLDRMYCQTIRTVRDISRDDRAIIATCSLRMQTDRLRENYSIDVLHQTMIASTAAYDNISRTHH